MASAQASGSTLGHLVAFMVSLMHRPPCTHIHVHTFVHTPHAHSLTCAQHSCTCSHAHITHHTHPHAHSHNTHAILNTPHSCTQHCNTWHATHTHAHTKNILTQPHYNQCLVVFINHCMNGSTSILIAVMK